MTVAELIAELQKMPQDLTVVRDADGIAVVCHETEIVDVVQYGFSGSLFIDFCPEFTDLAEGDVQFKAVQVS